MKKKNKDYYQQAAKWLEAQKLADPPSDFLKETILKYGNMACDFLQERISFAEFSKIENEADRWAAALYVARRCNPPSPLKNAYGQ